MPPPNPLSALVFRGTSGLFVALSLDLDIAAQAESPRDAIAALEENYRAHLRIAYLRGEKPFEPARPAPREYWDRFASARPFPDASATFGQVRVIET